MRDTELEMVNWFKAELRSYYHDAPMVKHLEEKLIKLENQFDAHSPNLTGIRVSGRDRDERLAEYAEEAEQIRKQLRIMKQKREMVEYVLERIRPDMQTPIRQIYSGKQYMAYFAYQAHYTLRNYRHHINKAILEALTKG